MLFLKAGIAFGIIVASALAVQAADIDLQMVDKNCWIEVFDDTKYDADDPHVTVQGPKEFASLTNAFASEQRIPDLSKLDMSNDIESLKIACGTH